MSLSCNGHHCSSCPQQLIGQAYVPPDGLGTSGIVVVAESPWVDEIEKGFPLAGASGYTFDRLLKQAGITRESLLVTNTINCKIPYLGWIEKNRVAAGLAIEHCRPYLDELVEKFKPRVIVALGGVALQNLTGLGEMSKTHAYVQQSRYGIPVIGTFHPSYIQRGQHKLKPAVVFALRRAARIAKEGFARQATIYLLDPLVDELKGYLSTFNYLDPLAFDIETSFSGKLDEDDAEADGGSEIVRVSFSWKPTEAVSVPWCEPFIGICKDLLLRSKEVVFWNQGFDVPRLLAAGVMFGGQIVDSMWAFHWLQSDLPKSLGFVAPLYTDLEPWKHKSSSEPALYSAIDADATIRCYYGIKKDLQAQNRWDIFTKHCTKALPILSKMGAKGLVLDKVKQDEFKTRLEAELEDAKLKLQSTIPHAVLPFKVYKKPPKDAVVEPAGFVPCVCKKDPCKKCQGEKKVQVFHKILPFNPDSPLQTANLIKHLKIPMPKNRKTGGESTGAKYLERFAKKHDVFKYILEYRKRADMLGTFIWPTNKDGRVTTQYGFHPSTLRKSSRSVNLQNIPKRSDLAKEFRKMLVAAPGHVLIEADSAAIEAVLVGFAAGDADYIRLAKLGVHDFLTSHIVGEPAQIGWEDGKLSEFLKSIKKHHKDTREAAKRCIHGSNYCLSPYGMFDEYQEFFPKVSDAEKMQEFYFGLFPKIKQWHESTLKRAHHDSYLDNHFGYRHHFYDIYSWDQKYGQWRMGNDAKRAIAFVPQSDASAIQTEYLLALAEDEVVNEHLRLIIHDSFILEAPEAEAMNVANHVRKVMDMPFSQLNHLNIGAEVQMGLNLGEMEVVEFSEVMV